MLSMQQIKVGACVLIGGTFIYKMIPNVYTTKQEKTLKYAGKREPQHINILTYPVVEELVDHPKFNVLELANLHFFWSNTRDPMHIGSLKMRIGFSRVGFPINMSYTSLDDVDLQDFGIDASSNTDRIKQSLVLSDSAKKFVIANEIHILNSTAWWVDPAILSFLIYIAFVAFLYLHLTKVKKFRIFIDACVLVTCGILYQLGFELYKDLLQTQSDRRTSQMGQKYTEGGIEYLDKLLQRNMLLQAQGDKSYTTSGDRVKSLFSVSKTDFTRRKRVLEQMYQKQLAEAVEKAEVGSDDDEEQDECE